MNRRGALAGMVSGGVTVWLWRSLEGGWFDVYELLPAFVVSLAASVAVAKMRLAADI